MAQFVRFVVVRMPPPGGGVSRSLERRFDGELSREVRGDEEEHFDQREVVELEAFKQCPSHVR
jgi:hypothetical protein